MKSYYQINKETDLLGSFDLLEMQAYILLLKYLLRMGKKEGVTPAEDWKKVKDLMARVTNHISFHARGVKPSEVTVEFYSPEVKRLFHAVYGDGNATWTKDWLDTFESVKDEIDRQVENERPMCQFAAISGKRCDNCQCPDPIVSTDEQLTYERLKEDLEKWVAQKPKKWRHYEIWECPEPLSEQEYPTEKAKAWLAMFDESDTAPGDDDGENWDKARQREDERNAALVKYLTAKVKQANVLFWNEPDRETRYGSLLDAMEGAGTGVPMSEDDEQYVCNDCGARFDDNYDAVKHWVTTHMTAEWFTERFSMGIRLNQQEIELLIKAGLF